MGRQRGVAGARDALALGSRATALTKMVEAGHGTFDFSIRGTDNPPDVFSRLELEVAAGARGGHILQVGRGHAKTGVSARALRVPCGLEDS